MQEVIIVEVESWEKYGCDILVDCKCNSTQRVHKIYHIYSIFAIFCEYRVHQIHQNSNSSKAHQDREDVLVRHLHLRRRRSPLLGRKESYYCSHNAAVILDLGGRLHRLRSLQYSIAPECDVTDFTKPYITRSLLSFVRSRNGSVDLKILCYAICWMCDQAWILSKKRIRSGSAYWWSWGHSRTPKKRRCKCPDSRSVVTNELYCIATERLLSSKKITS